MSQERILESAEDVAEVVEGYLGPIRTCGVAFMNAVAREDVQDCIKNDGPSALKRAFG